MAVFKDAEQMSSIVKELWENVLEDEDAAEQAKKAGLSVLTAFHDPEVHLWVAAGKVVVGEPAKADALIRLEMAADTAHDIYLKNLNLATALGTGKVKAKGPAMKLVQMASLLKRVYEEYPRLCRKHNLPT
jgi:putative sterol carrier protein